MADNYTEEAFKALKESINDEIHHTHDDYLDDDEVVNILEALDKAGFQIQVKKNGDNPVSCNEPPSATDQKCPEELKALLESSGRVIINGLHLLP